MMKWLSAMAGLFVVMLAQAQSTDVGLVRFVSGTVSLTPAGGAGRPLPAFSRIREGDRIEIAAGGEVRMVYFEGARDERWVGPASFRAERGGGSQPEGTPQETRRLPADTSRHLARVPALLEYARLGGVEIRGASSQNLNQASQDVLEKARSTYLSMRKEAEPIDITPELYFYAVLYEYRLFDEMKTVADDMLRKQPASEDVQALAAFVEAHLARRRR